jgi:hypothetical protein
MKCENCGIPIGDKPQDATYDERLCDNCESALFPECAFYNHDTRKCANSEGGYFNAECVGILVCERWKEA